MYLIEQCFTVLRAFGEICVSSRSASLYSVLLLDCGRHVFARYEVVEGDSTPVLDVDGRYALDVGDGGYFRRYSTIPTQDADIDLRKTISAGT